MNKEEIITIFTPPLQEKIRHGIELLQKAERLAFLYDKDNGFWLAFSGGKDSQALYHLAKLAGVRFKAHMSMTTVDPPEVIRFVKRNYPDVELIKAEKSIYDMAVHKHFLPTRLNRWCCSIYKEGYGAGKMVLVGIRKAESKQRSQRNEMEVSRKKFSGSYEEFQEWRKDAILNPVTAGRPRKIPKPKVYEWESVEQESTSTCIRGKDSIIVSPLLEWTDDEVWEFLNKQNIPHCELYDQGYERIGCIMCPLASVKNRKKDLERYPSRKDKWIKTIDRIKERNTEGQWVLSSEEIFDLWINEKSLDKYLAEKSELELEFE